MIASVVPMPRSVPPIHGSRMDAPAARPALFRFERPESSAAARAESSAPDAEPGAVRRVDDRSIAAWRGPVLACGVTIAATAGLAFTVLSPATGSGRRGSLADRPPAGSVILASAASLEEADAATEDKASGAEQAADETAPVVTALHIWDGRPIRAVPTDTLPEAAATPEGWIRADGFTPTAGVSPSSTPDVVPDGGAVAPAVWLTGEIAE